MGIQRSVLGDHPSFCSGVIAVNCTGIDQTLHLGSEARLCDATSSFNLMLNIIFPGRDMRTSKMVYDPYSIEGLHDVAFAGQVPNSDANVASLQLGR